MGIFGKKRTGDEAVLWNKEQIEKNVRALEVILVQLEGKKAITDKLKDLIESYKYVSPLGTQTAAKADRRIADLIDDIRIAAVKAMKSDDFGEAENLIGKIKVLTAERNMGV